MGVVNAPGVGVARTVELFVARVGVELISACFCLAVQRPFQGFAPEPRQVPPKRGALEDSSSTWLPHSPVRFRGGRTGVVIYYLILSAAKGLAE